MNTLLANDTDPNPGDVLTLTAVGSSQVGATIQLDKDSGQVSYDIGNAFQSLAEGEVLADSFHYTISDLKGALSEGRVDVSIVGVNDAPVTAGDSNTVVEDLKVSASGNVLTNDQDIDTGTTLQVEAPGVVEGTYGRLDLQQDGNYVYELNNANLNVQSLGRSTHVTDHFAYVESDGLTGTADTLDLFLSGTNDAPIVVAPLADGSELPDWLHFDAETLAFSGVAPKAVLDLDIRVTATVISPTVSLLGATGGDTAAQGSTTQSASPAPASTSTTAGTSTASDPLAAWLAALDGSTGAGNTSTGSSTLERLKGLKEGFKKVA